VDGKTSNNDDDNSNKGNGDNDNGNNNDNVVELAKVLDDKGSASVV
jgi:hypothetical protein